MNKPNFADLTTCVSAVMDDPLDVVWPYILDPAAWMTEFTIVRVEGERNKEGEIKKVISRQMESEYFYFKTLRVVPYRRLVSKAYTDDRNTDLTIGRFGFTGIEVLSLGEFGKSTVVTLEAYLEFQSEKMSATELSNFLIKGKEGSIALWERNFARLSALIGQRVQASSSA